MNKLNLKSMVPRPAQLAVPQRRKGGPSEPDRSGGAAKTCDGTSSQITLAELGRSGV